MRVARTARALGLDTVAVFTEADSGSPHTKAADAAVRVDSYLDSGALVAAAKRTGADCVHPGYGFLAENADFARAVEAARLVWVGPPADSIDAMGDKAAAKARMRQADVPVIPGALLPAELPENLPDDELSEHADRVGYPLLVKAVAGGGGRGLRRVDARSALAAEVATARSEAEAAFGDGRLMLERLVDGRAARGDPDPRRRPRPRDPPRRARLLGAAPAPEGDRGVPLARGRRPTCARAWARRPSRRRGGGLRGAGTVEFLLAPAASSTSWR